jgi:hypothetical protein
MSELNPSQWWLLGSREICIVFDLPHMEERESAPLECVRFSQGNKYYIAVNRYRIWCETKSPEEGHRTVGFQISGDGKFIAQKIAMKEKNFLFGEAIRGSTMW